MTAEAQKHISRVGLVLKSGENKARDLGIEVSRWLTNQGITVLSEHPLIDSSQCTACPDQDMPGKVDLIVVLGGDGTLIYAASLVDDEDVPILGVNVGTLGFLTEITTDELFPSLRRVLKGKLKTTRRNRMHVLHLRGETVVGQYQVLNDAVIHRGALSRISKLRVMVEDTYATNYRGDGLIVATPTGSTAYNLAAGGAILHPALQCKIITPINPHTLTDRAIALPADSLVEVELVEADGKVFFSADGQEGQLMTLGDVIRIESSNKSVSIVESTSKSYFSILRQKLGWGEES